MCCLHSEPEPQSRETDEGGMQKCSRNCFTESLKLPKQQTESKLECEALQLYLYSFCYLFYSLYANWFKEQQQQ